MFCFCYVLICIQPFTVYRVFFQYSGFSVFLQYLFCILVTQTSPHLIPFTFQFLALSPIIYYYSLLSCASINGALWGFLCQTFILFAKSTKWNQNTFHVTALHLSAIAFIPSQYYSQPVFGNVYPRLIISNSYFISSHKYYPTSIILSAVSREFVFNECIQYLATVFSILHAYFHSSCKSRARYASICETYCKFYHFRPLLLLSPTNVATELSTSTERLTNTVPQYSTFTSANV
jgi:hypothetical protein